MSKTEAETASNDPIRGIHVAILQTAVDDAKRIGESRAKYLAAGRDIPKKAVRTWSEVRRIIVYIFSTDFEFNVDVIDQDERTFRSRILQIMAGSDDLGKFEETRICPKCKQARSLATEFGERVISGKKYRQSWCKFCRKG